MTSTCNAWFLCYFLLIFLAPFPSPRMEISIAKTIGMYFRLIIQEKSVFVVSSICFFIHLFNYVLHWISHQGRLNTLPLAWSARVRRYQSYISCIIFLLKRKTYFFPMKSYQFARHLSQWNSQSFATCIKYSKN